jgi:hypothetical protein
MDLVGDRTFEKKRDKKGIRRREHEVYEFGNPWEVRKGGRKEGNKGIRNR